MKIYTRRALSWVLAIALLITCGISGLVLPTAADTSTFKLSHDELYMAPGASGYVTYVAVSALNLDGTPYTAETVTWTSSDTTKLAYTDKVKGIFKTVKDATGNVTITATNASGESHSCAVTLAWDGEIISGGDFETLACQTGISSDRWKNIIKSGKGEVAVDPDDATNHVLKIPGGQTADMYYNGLRVDVGKTYVLEFDIKGDTGKIMSVFINTAYTSGEDTHWTYVTPEKDKWTHYQLVFTTKNSSSGDFNRNYVINFNNKNTTENANTNPVYYDNVSLYELGTAESVTLDKTALELKVGDEATLTPTFAPEGATNNRIFWEIGDETVAKVENGKVTALKAGTTTVTMTSGILTATCEVTVNEATPEPEPTPDPSGALYSESFEGTTAWKFDGNKVVAADDGTGNKAATLSGKKKYLKSDEFAATIKAGKRYMLRWKVKTNGEKGRIMTMFYNKSDGGYLSGYYDASTTTDWMTYQYAFTAEVDAEKLQVGFYLENSSKTSDSASFLIDDVQIFEITSEFNFVPGGDMEGAKSFWFNTYYNKNVTVVTDTIETDNKVLHIPANTKELWFTFMGGAKDKVYEISFRYRGGKIANWFSASHSANYQNVGSTAASEEWTTFKMYVNTVSGTVANYFMLRTDTNGPADVYIDDVVVREIAMTMAETATVEKGATTTLTPAIAPADAQLSKFTWTSDNEEIATVVDGVVTGVAAGTANITVSAGSLTATCAVTVTAPVIPVATAIKLDKTTATLRVGNLTTITASVVPVDAEMPAITWTSSDEAVATVANGVVTAVAEGTATITATAQGLEPVTCAVTVKAPLATDPDELFPNGNFEGFAEDVIVPWEDFNLNEDSYVGKVMAGVGVDGSYGLQMGDKVTYASIKFADSKFALDANTTYRLSFMATSASVADSVRFAMNNWTGCTLINASSANAYIKKDANYDGWYVYYIDFTAGADASIHGNGGLIIERLKADSKTICFDNFSLKKIDDKAELFLGGKVDDAADPALSPMMEAGKVTVVTDGTNKVYKVNVSTDEYFKGTHFTTGSVYKISFDYKGGKVMLGTPTSKGFSFGTDGKGTVTAPESTEWAHFETTLNIPTDPDQATYSNRFNWALNFYRNTSQDVLVDNFSIVKAEKPDVTDVQLNKEKVLLGTGASETLKMTITPATGKYESLSWTSSDETVATVDENGKVTATNTPGTATITATVKVNDTTTLTAQCTIVVLPAATSFEFAEDEIVLAPNRGSTSVYKTLKFNTVPAEAFVADTQWSSSDPTVATVDENGTVKALAKGTTTITVTDGKLTDTITVKVDDSGERIIGGDFEGDDWSIGKHWVNNVIKDGSASLVTDPTDVNNTVLSIPAKLQPKWYFASHVNPGRTYKLTFRAMGGGGKAYINFSSPSIPSGNGWHNKLIAEDAWTTVSFTFTTNTLDDGTAAGLNRNYTFGFGSQSEQTLYIDDVTLVELPIATDLSISGESLSIYPGNSTSLALTTTPAEASVGALTWTSSNPDVVAVDSTGKVTAVANSGSATITVTSANGLTDTIEVKVDLYAELLTNGDFEEGTLNWTSSANVVDGVGRDGGKGLVLSKVQDVFYKGTLNMLPGTTYIVSWDYLATKEAEFRLWSGSLNLGSVRGSFSDANAGKWVTKTKVFTTPVNMVDINSSVKKGWIFSVVSDVVGTYSPTIVDNVSIRVYDSGVKADSIKLNYDAITLLPGRTQNLGIIPTPTDANINFSTWTSSNEDVVTVENGIVTAVGKGVATITAETMNGKSATCTVTVSGEPAFILNGTFEAETDTAWQTTTGAEITADGGVNGGKGGSVNADGKLSQSFKNLKPDTTYELFFRYRSVKKAKLGVDLLNGSTNLLEEANRSYDSDASWVSKKVEFKTGETVEETTTLVFSFLSGTGPVLVDYVFVAQKAELVDLVVKDVVWDGGDEQVKPGTELLFAITVKNQGTDAIKAGSTMMVDICVDSKPVLSFPYTFASEFSGGSTAIVMGTEPWVAVEGDHVISARVNSTLSILEMDTTNNNTVQTDLRVNDVFLEVPEIAEKAGFTQLGFSDDFNSLHTIDTKATGEDGYKWYVTRPYSSPTLTEDDYAIEDGILILKEKNPRYNYGLGTTDMKTDLGYQYRFGYMETRLRIPRPRENQGNEDGVPAIWSLPQGKLTGDSKRWVEMDWLEYWGINGLNSKKPGGFYTITLHDQTYDENNKQIRYNKNKNYAQEGLGDGEWHNMAWLWMEDLLIAYIDDVEVFRLSYDEEGMSSAGGDFGAFSFMNEQYLPIHISGSADNPLELDYLRIWTGLSSGNKDQFEEEEEEGPIEEDNIIVDMLPEEFWYNYCTDDWGDNVTEVTYDNYYNVLGEKLENGMYEGEYYWSKLSEERKAEINELLASYGQPTYDELLAAALAMAEKVDGGWTPEEDLPEGDQPEDETPEGDEPEGGESEEPDEEDEGDDEGDEPEEEKPEDNAPTGATTVLPLIAAMALLISLAALVLVRKRDRA